MNNTVQLSPNNNASEETEGSPPSHLKVVKMKDLMNALHSQRHDFLQGLAGALVAFLAMGALVVVLLIVVVLVLQRILGSTISETLKEALSWKLGVSVRIGHVSVSIFSWTVQIRSLVLQNPKGFSTEEALITAELISVTPEVFAFLTSGGQRLTIHELILSGIVAHVEYQNTKPELRHTNVGEILHKIKAGKDASAASRAKWSRWLPLCFPSAPAPRPAASEMLEGQRPARQKTHVELRHVCLADMSLVLAKADHEGPKPHVDLDRLEFDDFSREGKYSVGHDVVAELVRTALLHMAEHMTRETWLRHVRSWRPHLGGVSPTACPAGG